MPFLLVWAAAILVSMGAVAKYQMKPGTQREAPHRLSLRTSESLPHLYIFMHPQCPCSAASLSELERIQSRTVGKLTISVVFVTPRKDLAWADSGLERRAKSTKGWIVTLDPGGRLAQSMGAATSGFAILFDRHGNKVFQGGITSSRGHEGDNAGHDAIVQFITTGSVPVSHTPVFGCSLGELGASRLQTGRMGRYGWFDV